MSLKDFWGQSRKIRTASVDTDVISDILALKCSYLGTPIRDFHNRWEKSFQLLSLLFSVKVKIVGLGVIKRELSEYTSLRKLYDTVFSTTIKTSSTIKKLARAYRTKTNIKPADTFILATASVGNIDCFFSWNRKDIVNEKTLKVIEKINKSRNIQTPLIITPEDFLDGRFAISQILTLSFFSEAIPCGYRPRFFPSKQIL
jgi:hypothetical protein